MAANPGKAKRHVVLVVDDHEPTRALVARILEQELGVQIVLAGTCEEAVRVAEQRRFDVVVLDLLMPGMGGIEVLRHIRTQSANQQTPVVILSVLDDKESVDRCMALKAHAFVAKPVNRRILAGIVKAQLPSGPEIPDSWDTV
jgi:two-component system phosphate regulon response regulator PhoB